MKKVAYYKGCLASLSAKELDISTQALAPKVGLELIELESVTCCGAGDIHEAEPDYYLHLNARILAYAEATGCDTLMTVCNVCTLNLRQANHQLQSDEALRERVNDNLETVGVPRVQRHGRGARTSSGSSPRASGYELLQQAAHKGLKGLKIAPFYGCQILRPSKLLGFEDPDQPSSLERIIEACGGEAVDYPAKIKCCGFPIIQAREETALGELIQPIEQAKEAGADAMVTPCPLCHLSLDAWQSKLKKQTGKDFQMPILHLSQLIGVAAGLDRLGAEVQAPRRLGRPGRREALRLDAQGSGRSASSRLEGRLGAGDPARPGFPRPSPAFGTVPREVRRSASHLERSGWPCAALVGGVVAVRARLRLVRGRLAADARARGRRSPGLPAELDGLRIAHLSDFHLGAPSRGARAVRARGRLGRASGSRISSASPATCSRTRAGEPLLRRAARAASTAPTSCSGTTTSPSRAIRSREPAELDDLGRRTLLDDESRLLELRGRRVQLAASTRARTARTSPPGARRPGRRPAHPPLPLPGVARAARPARSTSCSPATCTPARSCSRTRAGSSASRTPRAR